MPATQFKGEPSLKDLLDLYRKDILMDFNCCAIAQVTKFNAAKQTCEATINYRRSYLQTNADGTTSTRLVEYPMLVDVPVMIMGAGNATLTFPSAKIVGFDTVILFNDRDFSTWFDGTNGKGVPSRRLHSLADGIAILGLRSAKNFISDYDATRVLLRNAGAGVGLTETKIKVYNATTTLNTQLQNLMTELNALTTQLQNLTTALALLTVSGVTTGGGSSGVPVNAVAITAIGVSIATIQTNMGNTATAIGGLLE